MLTPLILQHRAVRDLAWALLNPPLFNAVTTLPGEWLTPIWQDEELYLWLQVLDANPSALLNHLKDQRATRLGVYFEQLLSFYFSEYPRFSLLAKNLQANDANRTVGEYDFIVLDHKESQHYHIEVAVKFYIGLARLNTLIANNPPLHNWHLWVGPNKKDTLGIKMRHLIHHQLCLAGTEAGERALASIGLSPGDIQPKLLLAGRLYYPEYQEHGYPIVAMPKESAHSHNDCSPWLNKAQLLNTTAPFIRANCHYIVLPRQLWMTELTLADIKQYGLNAIAGEQFLTDSDQLFTQDKIPLHIAEMSHSGTSEVKENKRFFLIP